jgi:hypothetical protein
MIQALKGALEGHIGLLLNDPYKRDRIDGVCMWIRFSFFVSLISCFVLT